MPLTEKNMKSAYKYTEKKGTLGIGFGGSAKKRVSKEQKGKRYRRKLDKAASKLLFK